MADVEFKLDPNWWRQITAGPEAQQAVDAKADRIGEVARGVAGVDHSGDPVEVYVKHGSRDEKAAQAWVGIVNTHGGNFAANIEASRGPLNKAMGA